MRQLDAYDLAMLAAQLMRRQDSPTGTVKTALKLVEAAKHEPEGIRLEAFAKSPEALADWDKQQSEYLDSLKLPYEKGVKLITGQTRRAYALKWLKEFLAATKYKEKPPEQREPYVEAWLAKYRNQGFTGTEAKKIRDEFDQWRGKGRQGRVKKRASDGRLKANREKKRQAKGKEALAELTKPKLGWEAVRGQISRGKKTPNLIGDAAPKI